jgi:signal peptide peptidase SppA
MFDRILTEARSAVWLIRRDKLDAIMALLESRASGIRADGETLAAFARDNQEKRQSRLEGITAGTVKAGSKSPKAIGVIPILGSIVQRGNLFTEASGTASADQISRQFDALMENEQVGYIVGDFDSPGGTVCGVPELASKIAAARGRKPMIACVNSECCSAALWLASAFDEICITPSGCTGSIGCYAVHVDASKLNETLGVKPTYIAYGKYKTENNSDEPLNDEGRAEIQARVDNYGRMFEQAVADNRGVPLATVKEDYGQGRTLDAKTAKSVGLVDKIESFDETIARLLSDRPKVKRRLAHAKNFLSSC